MANRIDELPQLDTAEYLKTNEDVAECLREVMEYGEPGERGAALGHIAKARGMMEIARLAGIGRKAVYNAIHANAQLRLKTVQRVCKTIGVALTVRADDRPIYFCSYRASNWKPPK